MFVGEDKMKIRNIVRGSLKEFEDMYSTVLPQFVDILPDQRMMKVINYLLLGIAN